MSWSLDCQSGIAPSVETLESIEGLRSNKSVVFFATFKIDDECRNIVPDVEYTDEDLKGAGESACIDEFESRVWPHLVSTLVAAEGPRYAVVDFHYRTADVRAQRSLISLGWCPRGATAKAKMIFAATKTAFEQKIDISRKYQANDEAALEYKEVYAITQRI